MSQIKKSELRRKLLEQMCYFAENIDLVYYISHLSTALTNTHFSDQECPEAFKPGVADKLIFNKIIDKVIDNVHKELKNGEYEVSIMGLNILAEFYYPKYGNWKVMPLLPNKEIFRF